MLVISTPPGLTAKWLVPRLYRFLVAHPEIDTRVSATIVNADLHADGVDVAIRNLRIGQPTDPDLVVERLIDLAFIPVCSPRLLEHLGDVPRPADLAQLPLIHDDMLTGQPDVPTWADWLAVNQVDGVDLARGLRLNSADHALEAAVEGAGVLLAHTILAHDDLRSGRLVAPFKFVLPSRRAYHLVCPRSYERRANVQAFCTWIKSEISLMDRGAAA